MALTYVGFNVVFTTLLFAAGFRAMEFSSSAMEPTLIKGDRFLIDRNRYRYKPCDRDDLVVTRIEGGMTVKRVIAVSGDTIEGRSRQVLVNGHSLDEPFVQHTLQPGTNPEQDTFGPIVVSEGKYFVMGDNRDVSRDSRSSDFGEVDRRVIAGKPLFIYLSLHHWSRRGRRLY
ncbi:MAG: signal peptidase I [Candidatus Sulfotelmatobacter sp.]